MSIENSEGTAPIVPMNRRGFLEQNALGLGTVALATLLQEEQLLAKPKSVALERQKYDLKPKSPPAGPTDPCEFN